MASIPNARSPRTLETAVSWCVLAALGVVLAWVLVAQRQFGPAVTVAATAARQAGQPVGATAVTDLFATWPAGLRSMSAAEAFTPETLSDKIDGKAELYLSAGFVAMRCQRVALAAAPDSWMEIFVFDMARPANAFSVFSSQKRADPEDVKLGDYAYRAGNALCVVHGQFYVEFIAADDKEATMAGATALARAFVAATVIEGHADVGSDTALFPKDGQVAGSLALLSADVFGFDRLKDVFVARYPEGGGEVTLFVTRRAAPADAAKLAGELRDFFVKECGGKELAPPPAAPTGAVVIDSGGAFDGVFVVGSFLAGVHQSPSREATERWMARLHRSLSSGKP